MKPIMLVSLMIALILVMPIQSLGQKRKTKIVKAKSEETTDPALTVTNNPTPAYLSGEINIFVRGDENPIIRIQMVANGQSLIEFPAIDRIFKVNPADPDLVTIEDSPTKENDRFILLRSSRQFLPQAPNVQGSSAATSMLLHMPSGMVRSLLIYPARALDQVVHRCVVRYDREAIVSARQKAGLAVNLDRREDSEKPKPAATSLQYAPLLKPVETSSSSASDQEELKPDPPSQSSSHSKTAAKVDEEANSSQPRIAQQPSVRSTEIKTGKDSKTAIRSWVKWGSEKLNWSKPQHGLKAAAQTRPFDARQRQVALSVRNTLSVPIKIAPNQPELLIQTLDEKGKVLQVEPAKLLKIETTRPESLIAPDETVHYLITYEAPILGAKQRLCVAIAQINAADEPVVIELTSGTR